MGRVLLVGDGSGYGDVRLGIGRPVLGDLVVLGALGVPMC